MNNENFLKFKELLRFVFENKYSDFYRLKYEKAGFNPLSDFNSLDDIKKIPFLTREELSNADLFKLLFIPKKEVELISPTSGTTTGKSVFIFFPVPIETPNAPRQADFTKKKKKTRKVLVLMNPFHLPLCLVAAKKERCQFGQEVWELPGDIHNISSSCQLASTLGVNAIVTTPTLAIILKDYLEHYPDLKKSLKNFQLTGELVGPEKKKLLQELYPDLEIFLYYSNAEAGIIGSQCPYLAKRKNQIYYHSTANNNYLEVINPETGKEVNFGEKGELVLTAFWNLATPLIKYRTGDLVSFVENDCPCKIPGPLLQVWGRTNYDSIRAGGFELRTEMLEKPLLNLRDCLQDNFEAHIYENFVGTKPKIRVVLNLSLREGIRESPELKQKIVNELLENWQLSPNLNLKRATEEGLFEPLQINFVKFPKSLELEPKRVLILH